MTFRKFVRTAEHELEAGKRRDTVVAFFHKYKYKYIYVNTNENTNTTAVAILPQLVSDATVQGLV